MKSFRAEPFNQRIGVTTDPKQCVAWYNRYQPSKKMTIEELGDCCGMALYLPKREAEPRFVIYMDKELDISTLFHESLHAAHNVMKYCCVDINYGSTETQAYLMEHIAGKVREKCGF